MNMKKVEPLGTSDLRHLHRERQSGIGRGAQRVMRNIDSVEMKIDLRKIQPNRLSVAEEIDFVTAACQLRSERCCQDPTAANQRKTRDPNFERPRFRHTPV